LIASSQGGVNIEKVAADNPEAILYMPIDITRGNSSSIYSLNFLMFCCVLIDIMVYWKLNQLNQITSIKSTFNIYIPNNCVEIIEKNYKIRAKHKFYFFHCFFIILQ